MTEDDHDAAPPQDNAAEMSVLGAMLLSKAAIDDASDLLDGPDFYRPAHEQIFDAIVHLHAEGEPADAVTVMHELQRRGELVRVGGAPYLHTLTSVVPTVTSAAYYAGQVADAACDRRLEDAGGKVRQLARAGIPRADKGDQARKAVDDALDGRQRTKARTMAQIMPAVIEAAEHGQTAMLSTPWPDLDRLIGGLAPGRLVIFGASPGVGKALALDTPLPTPTGWTTMGDVAVGDQLVGADGRPTTVVGATEVMHDRECFEVRFDDGTVVIADAEHQWLTTTRASRVAAQRGEGIPRTSPFSRDQRAQMEAPSVKTTRDIRDTLRVGADGRVNHAVALAAPLAAPAADLPMDPYVLGVWLGDGTSRSPQITTADPEIVAEVLAAGYPCRKVVGDLRYSLASPRAVTPGSGGRGPATGFGAQLRDLDLLLNKHIPPAYLRASEGQRWALLQGLMDTDGTINKAGRCSFAVTSRQLARDAHELIASLGIKVYVSIKSVAGRTPESSTCFTLGFQSTHPAFRLTRKRDRQPAATRPTTRQRMIVSVQPVESVPVRCVQVDNADHLYLATRSMVPTHNSIVGTNLALHYAHHHGHAVLLSSMEMPEVEVGQRMLAAHASVSLTGLHMGTSDERDWGLIAGKHAELEALPIVVDDTPTQTVMHIRRAARDLQRERADLALVVVDYLQLIHVPNGRSSRNRAEEISEISRGLKLLARESGACVVALCQLNRAGADRDGGPRMSDIREGGAENDADQVILMHRPEREIPDVEVNVGKNRHGPQGACTLQLQGHYARLVSVQQQGRDWSPSGAIA